MSVPKPAANRAALATRKSLESDAEPALDAMLEDVYVMRVGTQDRGVRARVVQDERGRTALELVSLDRRALERVAGVLNTQGYHVFARVLKRPTPEEMRRALESQGFNMPLLRGGR